MKKIKIVFGFLTKIINYHIVRTLVGLFLILVILFSVIHQNVNDYTFQYKGNNKFTLVFHHSHFHSFVLFSTIA